MPELRPDRTAGQSNSGHDLVKYPPLHRPAPDYVQADPNGYKGLDCQQSVWKFAIISDYDGEIEYGGENKDDRERQVFMSVKANQITEVVLSQHPAIVSEMADNRYLNRKVNNA